jgi:hypothetical protein
VEEANQQSEKLSKVLRKVYVYVYGVCWVVVGIVVAALLAGRGLYGERREVGSEWGFYRWVRRLNWRYEFLRSTTKTVIDGRSRVNGSGSA